MPFFQRAICLVCLTFSLTACSGQPTSSDRQQPSITTASGTTVAANPPAVSTTVPTNPPVASTTATTQAATSVALPSATQAATAVSTATNDVGATVTREALPATTAPAVETTTMPAAPQTTPTPVRREPPKLALRQVVDGLSQPTFVTHAGDGTGRLFVVEKAGRIRIVAGGTIQPRPFLDITDRVGSAGSEQGLFSVAFHPQYRTNGLFFVDYTDQNGNTMISRFHVSSDPNRADPSSETTVLTVDQPEANHNGGQLAFGPDGYLYIGMGDGGGAGDRHGRQGNGQNGATLLGKILRIDVNGKAPYAIPPDNPFAGQAGMRHEVWATGVRNPWRFSFDRATGDLFIADVGQDRVEEVDFQPAHSRGGQNYGWRIMEGSECFNPSTGCSKSNLTLPVAEYSHDFGCTIIGGYRYRGKQMPALDGVYLFGDYCSGRIWALTGDAQAGWTKTEVLQTKYSISSFGEDENGDLYLLDLAGGGLYRFEAQ